ncbi:hypothetical protein [Palleronia rufa]|uniref:hypothetical protein n=1 Tax=Palleronia rufa TaxID=1530186 RepID=UPI00190F9699|nr:hypothetical protein [Palleronia rufa]
MTRRLTAALVLLLMAGLLSFDLASSRPLDIYDQPSLLALGSGSAADGAHCAALPTE